MRYLLVLLVILALAVAASVAVAQSGVTLTAVPANLTLVDRVWAAWQPFTNGVMMWWSDSDQIWVMINNPAEIYVYQDQYIEGAASTAYTAPENRTYPIRGFGRVWEGLGASAALIGWAYADELGYDSAARRAGQNGEIIIQGPGNTQYGVTIAAGSNKGTWRVINIG